MLKKKLDECSSLRTQNWLSRIWRLEILSVGTATVFRKIEWLRRICSTSHVEPKDLVMTPQRFRLESLSKAMRKLSEHISANFGHDINRNIFGNEHQSSLALSF
jgi:hypothetical protein